MAKIAFIGCGNMGQAMALAALKTTPAEDILLTNRTLQKAVDFAAPYGMTVCKTNVEAVEKAEIILLCVKPQMMAGVMAEVKDALAACIARGEPKTMITVAAMLSIDWYYEQLGLVPAQMPFVRAMPNTPVAIGKGVILCATKDEASAAAAEFMMQIFASAGEFEAVPENLINAAGTLGGCTPAWTYMFIEALADGGVFSGVPRKQAIRLAAAAVQGAAALVLETGKHPEQLKDEVCSPAGTTIEGVKALEENGFRNAAFSAVLRAVEKGK
ncbi:MAG: pyrroline-5-carboxylate reductase [Clostridia bacterium]|nr:pyrroline-5-carboxylate reductase [Clostridia bacterium]